MDNNLHWPDLGPIELRSLFNEEGGKGEQKRGKGEKETKKGKQPNFGSTCTRCIFLSMTCACTDCTCKLCIHSDLCFALCVLYSHLRTSDDLKRDNFAF